MDGFYSGSPLGLQFLLASDTASQEFFSALPQDIQWQLEEHKEAFHSSEEMMEYAQKLMN